MKLLTRTTFYYITISLFIFFILGIVIYQLVKRLEDKKVNKELYDQSYRFKHDLEHINTDITNLTIISSGLIQLDRLNLMPKQEVRINDTLLFDPINKGFIPYRKLSYYLNINNVPYRMAIFKSLIESNYLVEQVALVIITITVLFLFTVYFLYKFSFGRIWADFFVTIKKIEHFDLTSPEKVDFPKSMIIEFNQLNDVIGKMINRISSDFQGLKDFTGNLSHEIMTPIAVIRSKADLLLQDKASNENQMKLAGEINAETVRLSKLVKALSLFTKLDHQQFTDIQNIDVTELIQTKLELFEDFIEARHLKINIESSAKPDIRMNAELADILFVNLVKNAIRHNFEGGKIDIYIDETVLKITNTGENIDFDPEIMFNRFSKLSRTSESLGIGLSLAKKICEYYNFQIKYLYQNSLHQLIIRFKNKGKKYIPLVGSDS